MRVVVVEVFHCLFFLAALLVEEVGGDVVQIDELTACLCYYFTIPLAVCVIAPLYLAIRPFVTWCQ